MSKPQAFSRPNKTMVTCDTSSNPLPVSCTGRDGNMQHVDGSEQQFALPCGTLCPGRSTGIHVMFDTCIPHALSIVLGSIIPYL